MGFMLRKVSDHVSLKFPSVYAWVPCKEQRAAGASNSVVDYARGYDLVGTANIDKGLPDAIRAVGGAAAGNDFSSADDPGLTVGADDHVIALCVATNLDDANTYLYYGRTNQANAVQFSDRGVPRLTINSVNYDDTVSQTPAGAVAFYIGLRRDTNRLEFGHVTSVGSVASLRSTDAAALTGLSLDFSGGATNGLHLYNGASAVNPLGLYNFVLARFSGPFPDYNVFSAELVSWRTNSLAGVKDIPSFLRDL